MSHREIVKDIMHGAAGAPRVSVEFDLMEVQRFRMAAQSGKMNLFRLGPRMNEMLPVIGFLLVEIEALKQEVAELQRAKTVAAPVVPYPVQITPLIDAEIGVPKAAEVLKPVVKRAAWGSKKGRGKKK